MKSSDDNMMMEIAEWKIDWVRQNLWLRNGKYLLPVQQIIQILKRVRQRWWWWWKGKWFMMNANLISDSVTCDSGGEKIVPTHLKGDSFGGRALTHQDIETSNVIGHSDQFQSLVVDTETIWPIELQLIHN